MSYFEYDSNIKLQAWQGFRLANHFEKIITNKESSGLVNLYINNVSADYVHDISKKEHEAITYLQNNDEKIRDKIILYLFQNNFTNTTSISTLKEKLALFSLNIVEKKKKKHAQINFIFFMCCDKKLNLKVVMYKQKIKKVVKLSKEISKI